MLIILKIQLLLLGYEKLMVFVILFNKRVCYDTIAPPLPNRQGRTPPLLGYTIYGHPLKDFYNTIVVH